LRKHGPAWIPYQGWDIATRLWNRVGHERAGRAPGPGDGFDLETLRAGGRLRVTELESVNSAVAEQHIVDLAPDLGISLAAPVLKERVFALPRLGTINLHKGKLPNYRGMPPAFWEIKDGRESVGCTIHQVSAGLDEGPILIESVLPIEAYSTPDGLRVALDSEGNRLLLAAVNQLRADESVSRPQSGDGRTNSRPPLLVERRLQRDLAAKEGTVGAKRRVKDLVFTGHNLVNAVHRRLRPRSTVVVLLYHRVNDTLRDNVTTGIERFDRHMAYLKQHWPVVPLRAVVNDEVVPNLSKPLICITFDDGYRDNYDYAAPILLKHRLPATFFLSTDKLTNQTPFAHDLEKLGFGMPNMTWDQVREMQAEGLDFDSHTVNHVNLAQISLAEAESELVEWQETLRRELALEQPLFAYPYGGRGDITAEGRALVEASGYACCGSAYGRVNFGDLDRFNILWVGINYNFSLPALRSRFNGWS
jgi:peptidoglycan/xylan/chitin deacetylase (PgdA/CDA1 family)